MSSRDAPPGPGRRSSADIESTDPPDASGSDAFERFRYQAHLAASVCLATASGEDVQSVVCEHFEDIAIGDSSGWRHIQVKTRNAELGPWKSTDLLKKPGGALSSLFRTYYALSELGEDESCRLEIWLEGVVGRDDDAKVLTGRPVPEDAMANLVQRCSEKSRSPPTSPTASSRASASLMDVQGVR